MSDCSPMRRCRRRLPALFAVLIVLFAGSALPVGAAAPVMLEKDGFFVYFPPAEKAIGARLMRQLPDMVSFLIERGLAVRPPMHILLEADRDEPEVQVHVIPHLGIRIPLRAPGVLEDGYTESDPWNYFLFKGLCRQGIYGIRGGIPGYIYRALGEVISPNVIIPPWVEEGICGMLYAQYRRQEIQDPLSADIFRNTSPPDLDIISHHPQIWPGYLAYRIYGPPFFKWLEQKYGWDKILEFLQVHGRGIIPIEIDLKARQVFGKTGIALWRDFQLEHTRNTQAPAAMLITGYWGQPLVYWNRAGVFPGKLQIRHRGRYGYVEPGGSLWLSEYSGMSRIYRYTAGTATAKSFRHVWDPGPGQVAVTRNGHRPALVIFADDGKGGFRRARNREREKATVIDAPTGVIQLSGPVRDGKGRVAVAGNLNGNWDIWVYDRQWYRLTTTPSIEMDPWWEDESLVYASNVSGGFQIHAADGEQITRSATAAILPRQGKYLNLTPTGWRLMNYKLDRVSFAPLVLPETDTRTPVVETPSIEPKAYSPFKSLWPNYIRPDIFAAVTDLQIGIATKSRDVTGDFKFDAAIRYSFDTDFFAARVGFQAWQVGTQYVRYPLSYTTAIDQEVDEARNEIKLFWRPLEGRWADEFSILRATEGFELASGLEISLNGRTFEPLNESGSTEEEGWLGLAFAGNYGIFSSWANAEFFTENRQSLSLGGSLLFGDQILSLLSVMGGRSWGGEPSIGHTTFRVGGNIGEGYFTRRPTRLFPIRGFDANLLEASKAAAGTVEVFWPLANLQYGYATLPLYLHRLRLGTFVDAGFAAEEVTSDDLLVGAGFELVTSLEFAWGNFSAFRAGVAWPLRQPDFLDEDGPKFVFQLGRPL